MNTVLKMSSFDAFTDKKKKLQDFLIKLKLYIRFNQMKFIMKINKDLYTVVDRIQHSTESILNCMSF